MTRKAAFLGGFLAFGGKVENCRMVSGHGRPWNFGETEAHGKRGERRLDW
jgi:hypothetical protein